MDRGIFTTIYATPHRPFTKAQLLDLYRAYYANAPFVRVTDQMPATKDRAHTNFIDMTVRVVREPDRGAGRRGQPGARRERRGRAEFQPHVRA